MLLLCTVSTDGMITSLVSHLIPTALGEARAAGIPSHELGDKAIPHGDAGGVAGAADFGGWVLQSPVPWRAPH